ncbi:MAG: ABC transporter permease subunit [Gemmatales bacterium]|nr:ABC transporter permease subunit [Gemmatales bacterium]MDW8387755.1 ABC transporter permease subunit [Gemmatales bacterium]
MAVLDVAQMELVLTSRRNSHFLWRYIYGGWLVLQFCWLWFMYWIVEVIASSMMAAGSGVSPDPAATQKFLSGFLELFLWQQMVLIILVSPAIAAGAITDEKERGTLQYLLTADLTSSEIVLGKLLGRLVIIATIFATGIPFLFAVGGALRVSPGFLAGAVVHAAAIAFAATSASILASVWAKRTRDAIVHLYLVLGLLFLLVILGLQVTGAMGISGSARGTTTERLAATAADVLSYFDPSLVLKPELEGAGSAMVFARAVVAGLSWVGVGVLCLAVAAWRLRPAYNRQLEGIGQRRKALLWWARPPIHGEPVRWKERYVTGIAPLPALRYIPQNLVMLLILLGTTTIAVLVAASCITGPNSVLQMFTQPEQFQVDQDSITQFVTWISLIVLFLSSLIVGIRCSGAITGEREKHTWESLLMTPLETQSLVQAKLWGILGATYPYLLMYAIPMFLLSLLGGPVCVISFVISLGVTWLAMFYTGSTGLWCSARSNSSWRSLVGTLAWAYLGGFLAFIALFPLLFAIWIVIVMVVELFLLFLTGNASGVLLGTFAGFAIAGQIALALGFLLGSWFFLREAEKRVADYDRARHWRRERKRQPKVVPRQVVEYNQTPDG